MTRQPTPKRHCESGLGGFEAVQTGAGCARVVYVASGSRARAGTSPARPPPQPQGGPCRSRARTGASDGISGGASWASAARQTRLYVTWRTPRSSRTALDVTCEHIADAGEGKRWSKLVLTVVLVKSTRKPGRVGACDALNAVASGRQIAWKQGREAAPSTSRCSRQPEERLFARRRRTACDCRTMPQVSRRARAGA